jgi:hypothetical protein
VLRDGDELGLHIHGWKGLFEAAGLEFRNAPTFWDDDGVVTQCASDCGHEVPISAYSEDELAAVVDFSLDTLEAQGFGRAAGFRAGGWMAEPHVRSALARNGITTDGSAVATSSQPYPLETTAGALLEIPDNGALADYVSADEMVAVFDRAAEQLAREPGRDVVVSIGFHQETAARFVPRVEQALATIVERSEAGGVPVAFVTTQELAHR